MKTLKLNDKEIETIKNALDNQKFVMQIKANNDNIQRKELAINELYNIESVEKKLKTLE